MPKAKATTLDQLWAKISTLDKEIKAKTREKLRHHKQLAKMLQRLGIVSGSSPKKKRKASQKKTKPSAEEIMEAAGKAIAKDPSASKAELSATLRAEGFNIRANNPHLAQAIKDAKRKK